MSVGRNFWTNGHKLQLIRYYEHEPCLWHKHDVHYKSVAKRNAAWNKIAKKMGVTADEARRKVKSLKNSRQKQKYIPNSEWFAVDAFEFLDEEFIEENLVETLPPEEEKKKEEEDMLEESDSSLLDDDDDDEDGITDFLQLISFKMDHFSTRTKFAVQLEVCRLLAKADKGELDIAVKSKE